MLKVHLSKLTARRRGIWHAIDELEPQKIRVEPETILRQLDRIRDVQERIARSFADNPCLEVAYEEFFGDARRTSRRVLRFLQVEPSPVAAPDLKKLNPDSTRQIIQNHEEISAILKGTPYERCLD